jgi:colanic acid/amylovoran biosynthesis glycosyltransferase
MSNFIIFKTHSFPNISETFIVSNIIETIKKGYNVKIIVDTINLKTSTSQPDLLEQYGLMDKVLQFSSSKGKWRRYNRAIRTLKSPIILFYFLKYTLYKGKKSLEYLYVLDLYSKFRKAEAFHVHFATAINPLFELKEIGFLKSKIIVTFHGHDAHFLSNGEQLKTLINNFSKWVFCITVNSQFLKNKLIEKGFQEEYIKVIPIGIDTGFFDDVSTKNYDRDPFKIITVGRLIELKGQSFGINVVKLLVDKGYNIEYTLVGDGNKLDYLKNLVVELNLEKSVYFCGLRNQIEIKELLIQNHLFLMTSTKDKFNRCEAFGVVSLEAQAMGLPVVGFKSGGFPETLIEDKTGITVKDKDIDALADVIIGLIKDNGKTIAMSNAGRKHIKVNFDASVVTTKYLDLYS